MLKTPDISKPLYISTDSVWGNINKVDRVYGKVFSKYPNLIQGIEPLHFGRLFSSNSDDLLKFNNGAIQDRIPIKGLHGEIGFRSGTFKDTLINLALAPKEASCKLALDIDSCDYVLFHNSVFPHEQNRVHFSQSVKNEKLKVSVENHPHKGGFDKSVSIAEEMALLGVDAGITIDWYHLLVENGYSNEFNGEWSRTVGLIKTLLDQRDDVAERINFIYYHLPFGTNPEDSLPLEDMERVHFMEMREILNTTAERFGSTVLVLENQQRFPQDFRLTQDVITYQSNRNLELVELLLDQDIVSEN